jgi:hypothetical protein
MWVLIMAFAFIMHSAAQVTIPVVPGEGTLEEAILSAGSGNILQLEGGGEYLLSASSTSFGKITMPITIEVEPGAAGKAVLKLGPDAPRTKKYYFFTVGDEASLTLRGLDIHGLLNDTVIAASMVVFDGRPDPGSAKVGIFRFEDCIFHDFTDYIVHGMKDSYARGMIQDSVFINNVIVYNAKHFLQYKHVSLRHLEMSNSTIYNLNGMALKIGKIGYRTVSGVTDPTITPTGFIDHCTLDSMGDIHGHVQVDDAYHLLTVSNCIFSNQHQYDQPPLYFLYPHADTVVMILNTCFWKVAPPNAEVGWTDWIGYGFSDTITMDPQYRHEITGDFTLPGGSFLLTFGTNGKAIGDPRWVANAAGMWPGSSADAGEAGLLQVYPNPFRHGTRIGYRTLSSGPVSLDILDITGGLVRCLVNENLGAGTYTVEWDADGCEGGLYFCRMKAGNTVSIMKVIHMK